MKFEKPSHIKIYKMLTLLKTRDTTFIELIKNLRINNDLSEYFLQIFLIQKFAKELKEDPEDKKKNEIYLINKKLLINNRILKKLKFLMKYSWKAILKKIIFR